MSDDEFKSRVEKALSEIRPALQADGGDVELVDADAASKTAKVRFQGACVGCMGAAQTLEYGIANAIRRAVPEILDVQLVA